MPWDPQRPDQLLFKVLTPRVSAQGFFFCIDPREGSAYGEHRRHGDHTGRKAMWQFLSTPIGGSAFIALCVLLILHYIGNRGDTRSGQITALTIAIVLIAVIRAVKGE